MGIGVNKAHCVCEAERALPLASARVASDRSDGEEFGCS